VLEIVKRKTNETCYFTTFSILIIILILTWFIQND